MGGQRIPKVLTMNVAGPSITTIKRYNRQLIDKIHPGHNSFPNFKSLAARWKILLERYQKTHPEVKTILCELSEDESGILPLPQYSFEWDIVLGLCGKACPEHKCDDSYFPVVGDDWDRLVDIMQNSVYSHYTRIIMVNPLCDWLRPAVVHVNSCCNRFDHYPHVSSQWETTKNHFLTTLGEMGFILIGRGSDGDARRFLLQITDSMTARSHLDRIGGVGLPPNFTGKRPVALQSPGFTFACYAIYKHGTLCALRGIHSQDSIHKAKKLDAPLQGVKRMRIGRYTASANDLWLVRQRTLADQDHVKGLRLPDLKRDDRQNFMAVVRRSSNKTRRMLVELQDEHRTQGTHAVYRLIHRYLMLFFSKTESLLRRVEHAGYICRFLRLWRLQIVHDPDLTVQKNFYPNQTFNHVLLSCMAAVMYMIACRDLAPGQPICLHKLGSDCCEQCFSMAGGWGPTSSWRRNFDFVEFLKRVDDFESLQQLEADGEFRYKAHTVPSKCEFDRSYHEDTTLPLADMIPTPHGFSDELIAKHWKIGQMQAVEHALELHINDNVPEAAWQSPWEHDPPTRDAREYMARNYPGSDDEDDIDDSSDGDDANDDGDDANDDGDDGNDDGDDANDDGDDANDGDDDGNDDGDDANDDGDDANDDDDDDAVQFNHAVCLLAQENVDHDTFITIPGNPPTRISKNTAVIKLREAFKDTAKISASRLDRIVQLASSAERQVDDCGEMVGDKFELHDSLAFAVKRTGRYTIKFGRVKKMTTTTTTKTGRKTNKDRIYAVSYDNIPNDLHFIVELYSAVSDSDCKFTFDDSNGNLHEYGVDDVLGHVKFQFDRGTRQFAIATADMNKFQTQIESLQQQLDTQRVRRVTVRQTRIDRHLQEARALEGDRNARYRGDVNTMTQTRRTRSARRTGATTLHAQRGGSDLRVGMRVRLYHEVHTGFVCECINCACVCLHPKICVCLCVEPRVWNRMGASRSRSSKDHSHRAFHRQ